MSEDHVADESTVSRPTGKRRLAELSKNAPAGGQSKALGSTQGEDDRPGVGSRILNFFPEVVSEMRKVIWPTAKELVVYTIVVLVFLIVFTALVVGVDFLAGLGVEKILTS